MAEPSQLATDPGNVSLDRLTYGHPRAGAALRDLRKRAEYYVNAREVKKHIEQLERDAGRYRNGIDNILAALKAAPSLPIETLSREDQAKWTDVITGILVALGPYAVTGKPVTPWEYMLEEKE